MSGKYKSALVVEGGALRGIHTAGVMDVLMRYGIYFPYVIGVSAGALNTFNYISHQTGRSADTLLRYIRDSRYLNLRNIPNQKESAFGFDFMFHGLQDDLPFDHDTFNDPSQTFVVVATDIADGSAVYFRKGECSDIFKAGAASASLPLISPPVELDGHICIDGGVADPIPFLHAMEECEKVVVLLTRHKGFRKRTMPFAERETARQLYKGSAQMLEVALSANDRYNDTLDLLEQMEDEGKLFVIRPSKEIDISLLERNTENLGKLYQEGVRDGENILQPLSDYLGLTNALLQFSGNGTIQKRKYDIRNYTSLDRLQQFADDLAQCGIRRTGSDAHNQALNRIAEELESLGVPVYSDPYYFPFPQSCEASLCIEDAEGTLQIPCKAVSGAIQKNSGVIGGDLYWVREKNYQFIGARGKIAVVQLSAEILRSSVQYDPVFSVPNDLVLPDSFGVCDKLASLPFLTLAHMTGVKGVICIWNDADNLDELQIPFAQHDAAVPCVWIGAKDGAILLERMDRMAQVTASLEVRVQLLPHASARALYCILPGTESGESVLITAHTEGLNSIEGNGAAALIPLIAALRGKPIRRTHIFVFTSGHYRPDLDSGAFGSKWLPMHRDLWDGQHGHLRAVAALSASRLGVSAHPNVVFSANATLDSVLQRALEAQEHPDAICLRMRNGLFSDARPLYRAGIPSLLFTADEAALWLDSNIEARFSARRMRTQAQIMLDCLTLIDEMPRQAIGKIEKPSFRSRLPYGERGNKHEKSDD